MTTVNPAILTTPPSGQHCHNDNSDHLCFFSYRLLYSKTNTVKYGRNNDNYEQS
jgi:hypothetical protein